jgi:glycosyltransferase involved in cell wall biosynthesis
VANGEAIDRWYGGRGRVVISSALRDSEILSVQRRRPLGDGFRVLFVGFLRHEKGLDTLVAAFKILLEALPQAELEIVGAAHTVDQGVGSQLERELADLRAAGKARILPALPFGPELFQRYADADVLALPSRSEGTPRVLVEARAFRCPVVATRVGGIPSSIDDGEDGLIVPVDDPSALARALERVAADSNLRARLVERGLERARRATVEVFSSVLVEAIEDLVPDARRGQKLVRASR